MSEGWRTLPIQELLDGQWPGEWGGEPKAGGPSTIVYRSTELDDSGHLNEDGGVRRTILQTKLNAKQLKKDDLLLEASGGTPGRAVGRVALYTGISKETAMCANFLRVLRPKKSVSSAFLRWALVHMHDCPAIWRFQQQTTGMSNLKVRDYLRYFVDLPPHHEQVAIATILDTLDSAIQRTETLIAKMQQIKAGMMHDLFTRGILPNGELRPPRKETPQLYKESPLGWIPKEWEVHCLSDQIDIFDCRHYTPKFHAEGYPLIRPRNVKVSGLDLAEIDFVSTKDFLMLVDKHRPRRGDIVFSRNASFGTPCYIDFDLDFAIGQDVVVMSESKASTRFIFFALCAETACKQIRTASGGSTFGRINLERIRKLQVQAPGTAEQELISERLFDADTHIRALVKERVNAEMVKSGLMHDLLTGRVRIPESMLKKAAASS